MLKISALGLNRSVGKGGGGGRGKQNARKIVVSEEFAVPFATTFPNPRWRGKLWDAPQLNNVTEIARKFEVVFGDKFRFPRPFV